MMNVAVAAASRNEHLLVHTDSPNTTPQQITELTRRALVAEIAATMRLSERMVSSMLDDSQALANELPDTLGALRDGSITYQHAQQLVDEASALDAGEKREFEQAALPVAKAATPPQFRHSARKLRERMHPETIEARRQRAEKDRHIEFVPGRDGMAWLSLYNTAATTLSIFNAAHETAQSLKSSGDERTKRQIAADVVVDALMAGMTGESGQVTHETAAGPSASSGIRPTVFVTVPALTLLEREDDPAELDGYGPIDPAMARELAAQAPSFIRLLTHPETGAVLSVGRDRYTVPADLRRALELRDETCRFPGCNRRAIDCEIDHTHDWQFGGATEISNLACLCAPHHRLKHLTRWSVEQGDDGTMTWTSPLGRQYVTRPARAQHLEPAELGSEALNETDDAAPSEIADDDEDKNEPPF